MAMATPADEAARPAEPVHVAFRRTHEPATIARDSMHP
jgi:hypothetical protein